MYREKIMRRIPFQFMLLVIVMFAFLGQLMYAQRASAAGDTILVEIKDFDITYKQLHDKVENLPTLHRSRYRSIDGQKQILDMMVTEQVFYKNAVELGIDQREEVLAGIHTALRPVVNNLYFQEELQKGTKIGAKDVQKFYEDNIQNYTMAPRVSIQHLQVDSEDLDVVLDMLSQADPDFIAIIEEYSRNDNSASTKGLLRNIRLNGFIPGIGADLELEKQIADAEVSEDIIYGPYETSTGIHFFKKLDFEPAVVRSLEEVSDDIESRLVFENEERIFLKHIEDLEKKYNVVILEDIAEQVNVYSFTSEIASTKIVQGNHPEISLTAGEYYQALRQASQERQDIEQKSVRDRVLKSEANSRVLYAAAIDAKTLDKYPDNYDVQQVKLGTILNAWYNIEVYDKIVVTEAEILQYYNDNLHRITIPSSRSIRQFVAKNEKEAKKHQKTMQNLLKKNQTDKIIELIRKESQMPDADGLISNIYANGIIPGYGQDTVYNDKVWETKLKTVSPIFKNSRDEIVFFYIDSETEAYVRPIDDMKESMRANVHRQKANEYFEAKKEELMAEYNVVTHYDLLYSKITPEELFALAEDAQRRSAYAEAVTNFDQIIIDFGNTEHAYKALFMKAFILAENIGDTDGAVQMFEELLSKYPEGELNEAVEFMLESIKSGAFFDFMMSE